MAPSNRTLALPLAALAYSLARSEKGSRASRLASYLLARRIYSTR